MGGSKDLEYLLQSAGPALDAEHYVFVCMSATYGDHAQWRPIASFAEDEGLTLVIREATADLQGLEYDGVFRRITLEVHSSLEAVGLTAKFAERLAMHNISANVFAGFYHDHIFVPAGDADRAMSALSSLNDRAGDRPSRPHHGP